MFIVIIGGIKSIGRVAESVVPFMAAAYLVMAVIALALNFGDLGETFALIFNGAFNPQSAVGGFTGAAIIMAIRAGVARGLFSNEAGQGSTPIAHAVAQTDDPEFQGRMAMLGTFIDTIVICTMTALVILTVEGDFTGAGQPVIHAWQSDLTGFAMTSGAFAAAAVTASPKPCPKSQLTPVCRCSRCSCRLLSSADPGTATTTSATSPGSSPWRSRRSCWLSPPRPG